MEVGMWVAVDSELLVALIAAEWLSSTFSILSVDGPVFGCTSRVIAVLLSSCGPKSFFAVMVLFSED